MTPKQQQEAIEIIAALAATPSVYGDKTLHYTRERAIGLCQEVGFDSPSPDDYSHDVLIQTWSAWCEGNGFEPQSADDLWHGVIQGTEKPFTAGQGFFVQRFMSAWRAIDAAQGKCVHLFSTEGAPPDPVAKVQGD